MQEEFKEEFKEEFRSIPIYIIHYKKLIDRRRYLDKALRDEGFTNINWIDHIDRDTMTTEQKNMYKYDEDKWYSLNSTWKEFRSKPRQLSQGEIACTVSHIFIYKEIIDKEIPYALIFEDDAILLDSFYERLYKVFEELKEQNFDICYLGDAFGWTIDNYKFGYLGSQNKNKKIENKNVYPMISSKCAESFLLSNSGAKHFYNNFIPFCLPPDWMHTPIIINMHMKCFWAEPALIHQGSVDVYSSSVDRPV
jgi:GR25 family glycosyltransferase involved in LPS biosynthesis